MAASDTAAVTAALIDPGFSSNLRPSCSKFSGLAAAPCPLVVTTAPDTPATEAGSIDPIDPIETVAAAAAVVLEVVLATGRGWDRGSGRGRGSAPGGMKAFHSAARISWPGVVKRTKLNRRDANSLFRWGGGERGCSWSHHCRSRSGNIAGGKYE
jgi:hypothetical protein